MSAEELPLERRLRQETLFARERIYRFGKPTPMERIILPGIEPGPEVWVKREDLSPVKSYKWRGACNRMAILTVAALITAAEPLWKGHAEVMKFAIILLAAGTCLTIVRRILRLSAKLKEARP